MGMLAAE